MDQSLSAATLVPCLAAACSLLPCSPPWRWRTLTLWSCEPQIKHCLGHRKATKTVTYLKHFYICTSLVNQKTFNECIYITLKFEFFLPWTFANRKMVKSFVSAAWAQTFRLHPLCLCLWVYALCKHLVHPVGKWLVIKYALSPGFWRKRVCFFNQREHEMHTMMLTCMCLPLVCVVSFRILSHACSRVNYWKMAGLLSRSKSEKWAITKQLHFYLLGGKPTIFFLFCLCD